MLKLEIEKSIIINRPSKVSKTPYVADGIIEEDIHVQIHTPALGCCGLSDKDSTVLVTKNPHPKICTHTAQISYIYEPKIQKNIYIGINPKLAEQLVNICLQKCAFGFLKPINFVREKHIDNTHSRFDFAGTDENSQPFVLEVKNVPLADYVDCTEKEKKKIHPQLFEQLKYNEKISYFPDGYRKTAKEPISPRALKHLHDLQELVKREYRAIMVYVIQREDSNYFQPSVIDKIYRNAFYEAAKNGVEMRAVQFSWDENGVARLINDNLPIVHINHE